MQKDFRNYFTNTIIVFAALFISFSFLSSRTAQTQDLKTAELKKWVQNFYNAHHAKVEKNMMHGEDIALRDEKSSLTPELYALLKKDSEIRKKAPPGELAGLDFDPILSGNNPADKYIVGEVRKSGKNYLVDVFAVFSGQKKKEKPSVIAEVKWENGKGIFLNFFYPDDKDNKSTDLISILKSIQKNAK